MNPLPFKTDKANARFIVTINATTIVSMFGTYAALSAAAAPYHKVQDAKLALNRKRTDRAYAKFEDLVAANKKQHAANQARIQDFVNSRR